MATFQNRHAIIFAKLRALRDDSSNRQDLIDLLNKETVLNIDDDSLTSVDIENLMKILEQNTSIQHLEFSCIHIDSAMAHAIEGFLNKNRNVRDLTLLETTFEAGVEQILATALEFNPILKTLILSINLKDPSRLEIFTRAIAKNKNLETLSLANSQINSRGALALAQMLQENKVLVNLHLGYNPLRKKGASILAEGLKQNKTLKHLDLATSIDSTSSFGGQTSIILSNGKHIPRRFGGNPDADRQHDGVDAILSAIEKNSSLTSLNLRGNRMSSGGMNSLSRILKTTSNLKMLDLGAMGINSIRIRMLSKALKVNTSVTSLSLNNNFLWYPDVAALSDVLKQNSSLTSLSLASCDLNLRNIKVLAKALEQSSTLTKLELWNSSMGEKGAELLMETLQKKNTFVDVVLGARSCSNPKECLSDATVAKMESMVELNRKAWEEAQRRVIVSDLNALNIFPRVLTEMVADYAVEGGLDNTAKDSKVGPAFEALVQKFMSSQKRKLKKEKSLFMSIKFYLHKIYDWVVKQINKIKNLISPKKTANTVATPENIAQKSVPPATMNTNVELVENADILASSQKPSDPQKTDFKKPKR